MITSTRCSIFASSVTISVTAVSEFFNINVLIPSCSIKSGTLLGNVYDGLSGGDDFVIGVIDFARSTDFDGTSVSLRMDSNVWEHARTRSPGTTVVGWYHSHPGLGVFFSGTDRKTQRAFFNQPHSVGLVVDPIRLQEKWFIGPDSVELDPSRIMRQPFVHP